jgi:Xaa-Pro aminopeptidase
MNLGLHSKHLRTIAATLAVFALGTLAAPVARAQARKRELNVVYAERRTRLRAQVDGPVALFGFTGQEDPNPAAVFNQEPYFYYMTGHNEPGAAILLVPGGEDGKRWEGPHEILYLPPRNPQLERWEGPRMGPTDPQITEATGFEAVKAFGELENDLKKLVKNYPALFTLTPTPQDTGYPHAKNWNSWLYRNVPQIPLHDVAPRIGAMRQIKSPGELELLQRAIDVSVDAQLEAMRMMRVGLYEYEVAAKMIYIHAMGGSEREAYGAIVGAGFHSTILHYTGLASKIEPGDIVVLDVGAEYSGYTADITRTLPADGKYSVRQREIYGIVLGAQNAAFAACKPGMTFARTGDNSLFKIALDYINAHGADKAGRPLGRYFIHGLGHHIGLDVHDAGDPNRVLEPGMVVTIEPGIYIPEESLGVRIEDDVLVTETGCKMMTARLPRKMEEIEKIMADAKKGHE